jgi:hypothetical protein
MALENTHDEPAALSAVTCRVNDAEGDLDSIFENWQYLAALAWEGYLTQGPGAVVVTLAGPQADVEYSSAVPPACHARLVEHYDPAEQVVVVVRRYDREQVYVLTGRPAPRQCFECACAPTMAATVH